MTSAMCTGGEHSVCAESLTTPSGKRFLCDCDCHKAQREAAARQAALLRKQQEEEDEEFYS